MKGRFAACAVVVGFIAMVGAPLAGQAPAAPSSAVPRLPWGHPDLQGVWTSDEESSIPLERPARFAGKAELSGAELEAFLKERELERMST